MTPTDDPENPDDKKESKDVPEIKEEEQALVKPEAVEPTSQKQSDEDNGEEKSQDDSQGDSESDSSESDEEQNLENKEEEISLSKKEKLKKSFSDLVSYLKTKHGKITAGSIIGITLLTLVTVKACEPRKAKALYKVCSAFLEQQIEFPETIIHTGAEEYPSGVRIYYGHIDGFGQYLSEYIECSFERVPQKGLQLKVVVFNTIKEITKKTPIKNKGRLYAVEEKFIDRFNQSNSTGAVLSYEHEIIYPYPKPLFSK